MQSAVNLLCKGSICINLNCFLFLSGRRQSKSCLTHKNEEQQAEPGNSPAPLTLSPLPVPPHVLPLSLRIELVSSFLTLPSSYFVCLILDANMDFIDIFCMHTRSLFLHTPSPSHPGVVHLTTPHPHSIQLRPISPFTL